ncbi:MAG: hypothetical protein HOM21_14960, partial [Halobacteriovoraceae bacterium]|nr:hypothetical protein [Halobacteriovoraceae bacterium]
EVESFAEKSAAEFISSLGKKLPLIKKLLKSGFSFEDIKREETLVTGKKICITGSLEEKRSIIEGRIREAGGVVVSSVSKNTDFLVTNEKNSNSSKFVKAEKLSIPVVSEKELKSMIQ